MPNPSTSNTVPTPRTVYLTFAITFFLQTVTLRVTRSIVGAQLIGIALPLIAIVAWRRYDIRRLFVWRRPSFTAVCLTCALTLIVAIATDYLVAVIDRVTPIGSAYAEALRRLTSVHSFAEAIQKFAILCLVPALLEESLFRGFGQTSLAKTYGPRVAIVITSVIFAAAHPILWHFPLYFLLSVYLGWLYQWKQTLWLPVIAHLVNNTWTYASKALGYQLPGL